MAHHQKLALHSQLRSKEEGKWAIGGGSGSAGVSSGSIGAGAVSFGLSAGSAGIGAGGFSFSVPASDVSKKTWDQVGLILQPLVSSNNQDTLQNQKPLVFLGVHPWCDSISVVFPHVQKKMCWEKIICYKGISTRIFKM